MLLVLLVWLASCNTSEFQPPEETPEISTEERFFMPNQRVVVANRASGTLSVIDAKVDSLIATITMPDNGEPMYVVHIPWAHRVFVGDRANDRVVAFNEDDFSVEGTAPCGQGVFHMWASRRGNQLWVNNDIDNTTTIINPYNLNVIGTAQTPPDLVALGGKPHDVLVDPIRRFAYVSILGVAGANDYVVKYDGWQFQEVARAAVGKDPHLSATFRNRSLYVPCQSGEVYVLRRFDLSQEKIIPFAGAHGAGMSTRGRYFYVTDLPGNRVGVINTRTNNVVGTPITSPFTIPHNIAVNRRDSKIYVTHSGGTADKLSVYTVNPQPTLSSTLTLGLNPFGLTYYAYR